MCVLRPLHLAPKKKLFIPQNDERARYGSMIGLPARACKCAHRHKNVTGTLEHPVSKDKWVKLIFRNAFCVLNTLTRDIRAAPATFIPHHGTQGNSLTPIPAFCFQAIVTSKFSFRLLLLVICSNTLKRLQESSSHSFLCLLCSVTLYL